MFKKIPPFTKDKILEIKKEYPTPFHIYDEKSMLANARRLKIALGILPGYKQFFAIKATPNPFLMKIFLNEGFGMDSSSMAELEMCKEIGCIGENIMFSSNDTPIEEFVKLKELDGIMNLDDISHINFVHSSIGLPELVCLRFNPGPERSGNIIIGDPKESKYGLTRKQIYEGFKQLKDKGVKRFGLHTMVCSNELNINSYLETAYMMFELAVNIYKKLEIKIEFINLGGGVGIPYKLNEKEINLEDLGRGILKAYNEILKTNYLNEVKIFTEFGRIITGPYGYLVSEVRHLKHTYKDYVGLDSCMANLMRPALYGAYHHITILGKENRKLTHKYDVTGSLCENNDKFAIDRMLPKVEIGDIVVIHDSGAHGHAMGFNYNGKLRSSELLLREDGSVVQIRRAETIKDYLATLDLDKLVDFK